MSIQQSHRNSTFSCYNDWWKEAIQINLKENRNPVVISGIIGLCLLVLLLFIGFGHHKGQVIELTVSPQSTIYGKNTKQHFYYIIDRHNQIYGETNNKEKALNAGKNVKKSLSTKRSEHSLLYSHPFANYPVNEIGSYKKSNGSYILNTKQISYNDAKTNKTIIDKTSSNNYTKLTLKSSGHYTRIQKTNSASIHENGTWKIIK